MNKDNKFPTVFADNEEANALAYVPGNQTIELEIEMSGMTMADYLKDPTKGEWGKMCPDTLDYNPEVETDERNPLCIKGKKTIVTSTTLTVSAEGATDVSNPAHQFLWANSVTYTGGLMRITDTLFEDDRASETIDKKKVYVGWFDKTALSFPREGGATSTWTLEQSAGDFADMSKEEPPVTP